MDRINIDSTPPVKISNILIWHKCRMVALA